ncbi:MAG TPA: hypothetical protein ENI27_09145 [bacterium]|nr:hypothetical protein [bacterium]
MAKQAKRLLELSECCTALNMTEDEILYLVRTRAIPHRVEDDGRLTFTEREILGRVIPKPPKEAMGPPKFDISALSKDDIMSVFSVILQTKAAEEEKELKKTAPAGKSPAEVKEKPAEADHPEAKEKKEEVPEVADAGPETVTQEKETKKEPEKEPKKETKPKEETAAKPPALKPKK